MINSYHPPTALTQSNSPEQRLYRKSHGDYQCVQAYHHREKGAAHCDKTQIRRTGVTGQFGITVLHFWTS